MTGSSILEFTLMFPMFVFLFIGAFDWGFYGQALISAENAARSAAMYASTNASTAADSLKACSIGIEEFQGAPNMKTVTACNGSPLTVTSSPVTGPDGNPAAQVVLQYQTADLVPIPGVLQGRVTIGRVLQMRLRN